MSLFFIRWIKKHENVKCQKSKSPYPQCLSWKAEIFAISFECTPARVHKGVGSAVHSVVKVVNQNVRVKE